MSHDTSREDHENMSAQTQEAPAQQPTDGWRPGPPGKPMIPPGRTPQEIADQLDREKAAREEADRRELEQFAARQRTNKERAVARALALAREEFEKAGPKPGHEHTEAEATAGWVDVREHQASVRRELWEKDIEAAGMMELAGWTIGDIQDPKTRALVQGFIDQLGRHKLHLLLTGNTGAGKSSVAIAVGHAAVQGGRMTRLVTHKAFVAAVTARQLSAADKRAKETYVERLVKAPVLVLDDLGAGLSPAETAHSTIVSETLDLISHRWGSGRTTIVTTNFASDQIAKMFGDQFLSRLGADSVVCEFTGEDLRGTVSWGAGKQF